MPKEKIDYFFNSVQKDERIELTIRGAIGESTYFYEATSAKDVKEALENSIGDIHIFLNSGGGDVFQGIEIYNYLKNLSNNVTVEVTGTACSAASIVAMGANKLIMNTGTSLMIHEASTFVWGNKNELKKTLGALETIDQSIVDIYNEKTGIDKVELENYLSNETWITAEEAVELGFADEKKENSKRDNIKEDVATNVIINQLCKNEEFIQKISNLLNNENKKNEETSNNSCFFL
ncbi:head maturation protease, ClpP-related [Gemella massiliensis]|uniref:head maturation protease, ClpP-related n=1 Tax=Gemella massiliensis TaxID=1909670 RepID=UPI000930B3C4|nr:head maturation protease, ClpP-related [Gemella massiliensis]